VSPPPSRSAQRQQRSLIISLAVVVAVAFGALAATIGAGWTPKLGLDLAGGFSVVYKPATHASQSDLNETVQILRNRVDALGVSGAQVATQGGDISVSVPGVKNGRSILATIGQTAQLYFRPALCYAPPFVGSHTKGAAPPSAPLPACAPASQLTAANLNVNTSTGQAQNVNPDNALAAYPSTPPSRDAEHQTVLLPGIQGDPLRYMLGPAELTGHAVKTAYAQQNQAGAWEVNYTLTPTGSPAWDAMASKYFHQIIAIELDGVVQSAPIIQPSQAAFTSFGGSGTISGGASFTETYAKNLALAMQFGSLPVRLNELTTVTVSPTLGRSSLVAGLAAGLGGLILVLIYTILYYRLLGIVVISGLAVTGALLYSIISALGHTAYAPSFTLAGVTGLIVSIGITVDSYIVYFERLKDETRAGRTVRTSVDRGFKSAFRTVVAADLVSLAGAVVLYVITIGDVRGFAFFLGLSTLLDIIITYFFTRPLVILLGRSQRLSEARGVGISAGLAMPQGAPA